mmetsp:Transcript_12407/g.29563  ORF Transcript_12407/g.29563 Transcript_12407/m.29563 type:complete len:204 (-) Transcript_12407:555-1166(-)
MKTTRLTARERPSSEPEGPLSCRKTSRPTAADIVPKPGTADLPVNEGIRRSRDGRRQLTGVRNIFEVGNIVFVFHLGLVRRRNRASSHRVPVDAGKPLVLEDVVGASLQVAEPLGQVRSQQFLHQRLGVLVKVLGKVDLPSENLLVNAHGLLVAERGLANNHFVNQNTQGPPIHRLSMALVQKHLWRDVLRCSAQSVRTRPWF